MGVATELNVLEQKMTKLKEHVQLLEVSKAKEVLVGMEKKLDDTVKLHEAKKAKAIEVLKKVNEAVAAVDASLNTAPFQGAKAITAVAGAVTPAGAAAPIFDPAK